MRLFLNKHYFISVIKKNNGYSCQIMELIHGVGMYNAEITDDQSDVVSSIVHDTFEIPNKWCSNINEVCEYHFNCLLELDLVVQKSY